MVYWDIKELEKLCHDKSRVFPVDLLNSLQWKKYQAELHAEEADRIWNGLLKEALKTEFDEENYFKAKYLYAAHVECCAYCLRSMIDVLMQIINLTILNSRLAEDKVSVWNIRDEMQSDPAYGKIYTPLAALSKDPSFDYLNAFCNANKHRKLLKSFYKVEGGGGSKRNEAGIVFENFNYKQKGYPEKWGIDFIEKDRIQLISLIMSIGASINECMKIL